MCPPRRRHLRTAIFVRDLRQRSVWPRRRGVSYRIERPGEALGTASVLSLIPVHALDQWKRRPVGTVDGPAGHTHADTLASE